MFKWTLRALISLLFVGNLFGDGVIIPDPVPRPTPSPRPAYLNMPRHFASIRIKNNVARVKVNEKFENPYSYSVEGDYIFPIPHDAAIHNFSIVVDGKELVGKVMDRDSARQIYMDYIRRKLDPALLEYFDDNLFRARVFPIRPHKTVDVNIGYQHILPLSNGLYKLEYPLKIDALINEPIDKITISVTIEADDPIKTVFSPTHKIETRWITSKKVKVKFETTEYKPDNDFVLYYSVSRKPFEISVLTYKKPKNDGFFMLTISPGKQPRDIKPVPKDIVFVIDVSGSMSGEKIEQAKEGLRFMLNHLNENDKFNIVAFSDEIEVFRSRLVPASQSNLEGAMDFVEDLEAEGSTDINEALLTALRMLSGADRSRANYILFLTDGQPTAGVVEPPEIVKNVRKKLGRTRIFVFGVGYDVNTKLLDRLAEISNGQVEYIEPDESIERAITSLYRMIKAPALIDVALTISDIKTYHVYPRKMPDIYYGTQVVVVGRYSGSGNSVRVTLKGKNPEGKTVVYRKTARFPAEDTRYPFVARFWARRRIGDLLTYIDEHGENDEVVEEIKKLGEKYGIVTPYTSFLVTEEVEPYYVHRHRSKGIHSSSGSSGAHYPMPLSAPAAGGAPAGKRAFAASKMKAQYKYSQQVAAEKSAEAGVEFRTVGDKTFRYDPDKGLWVDTEYDSTKYRKINKLSYGSNEFMDLLQKHPELAIYLSVSKNLIIVIDGKCYMIKE